jgi:hypothetical protein
VRSVALVTLFVALLGFAVPVCAMPECEAATLSTCSDAAPACADCGDETVLMKHTPDEATAAAPLALGVFVGAAATSSQPTPALVAMSVPEPDATGAPPPLDPLGVRLIV